MNCFSCFRRQQSTSRTSKDDQVPHETPTDFVLLPKEQHNRSILLFFVFIAFIVFIVFLLIGVPVIRYSMSVEMNKTNSSKFDSLFNDNIHKTEQYGRNTIFQIENCIFLIISIVLSIVFSFLNVQNQSNDNNQSSNFLFFKIYL